MEGEAAGGESPGILAPDEILAGIRLACRCRPLPGGVTVTVLPESLPARLAACIDGIDRGTDGPSPPPLTGTGGGRLGVALDLGTTTLAGALVDLADGRILARASADNPQIACGEDLISRIVFGEETSGGFDVLRRLLLDGIGRVLRDLRTASRADGEIAEVTAAGNTVISHSLYGLSPAPIRRPPYRPQVRDYPVRTGGELSVDGASGASWRIFPSLGGFVGGDIVSGILASGMHRDEAVSLLFDVGTNGEVVLGNRDWRIACSSSAGPAFEGGEVACGMRAFPGAVESVRIDPSTLAVAFTVIGGGRPLGVCGSGILDLCAELFRTGLVDRSGRFVPRPGAPFREDDRGAAFVLADEGESGTGKAILLREPDLKSVLRTKAALCAAADALLAAVGLSRDAVEHVYVAGGFGNFLDLRSAMALGLFPPFPLRTFVPLGNASLAGAIGALRDRGRWEEARRLAEGTAHHELSEDPGFMDLYQRAMFIPHTDEESYRRVALSGETLS